MESLRTIPLKKSYDSDEDDLLRDFYIPSLSVSIMYRRIAGFFSSTSFALAASGLAKFLHSQGRMQLILNVALREDDFKAMQEGMTHPEEIVGKMMLDSLQSFENELMENHVRMLSWMIANRQLEIKVAIVDESRDGIFHQKIGILEDDSGNKISFSGSDNESAGGWLLNIEEFKVFRSWKPDETTYLETDINRFDRFWNGLAQRTKVIELPEAVRKNLIMIAPKSARELHTLTEFLKKNRISYKKKKIMEPHQEEALKHWFDNGCKGILEMATGTGKTFTAINCIKKLYESEDRIITVIVCPYQHLVNQWEKELQECNMYSEKAFKSSRLWKDQLANKIIDINIGFDKKLIIITTYDTFSSRIFLDMIDKSKSPMMIVADEVHAAGSKKRVVGLRDAYKYRLGLSATPSRWLDDEGTKKIISYFHKVVFEFSLDDAIAANKLTPYEYHPSFVELDSDELQEYLDIGRQIAIQQSKTNKDNERIEMLLIKRRKIITNARNKIPKFKEILDNMKKVERCLIYCSPKQITIIQGILESKNIIYHRFTSKESNEERLRILKLFADGSYQALVAMRCLDEGVDVPSTKIAIILASSGNPKEYIQRRGRILRRYEGKSKAEIYDILVMPQLNPQQIQLTDTEKNIIKKELIRYKEFSNSSLNPIESVTFIIKIMDDYKLF